MEGIGKTRPGSGRKTVAVFGALWLVLAVVLYLIAPTTDEGAVDWQASIPGGGWMAWTLATALFFWTIGALLIAFTYIGLRWPETPRNGILGIETTRGDRLFITLLGSAFINLAWLGLVSAPQWGALIVCLVYAAAVFRWV